MSNDSPAQRLYRRIPGMAGLPDGRAADDGAASPAPDGEPVDDVTAILPRWLPDGSARGADGWLANMRAGVRADPGRAGAIALGCVAVIAVLITVLTVVQSQSVPVVSAKLPPVQMVSSASPRPSGQPAPAGPVVVSVVGLVQTPGLVTLVPGARVADAVAAAGGALTGADSVGLNLARRVADGEQVVVGLAELPGGPGALRSSVRDSPTPDAGARSETTAAPGSAAQTAPVDLNKATVEQLDALPGVGPVTAAAIVAWREQNGSFASVDQLGDVDGIGPARLDKLRELVRV